MPLRKVRIISSIFSRRRRRRNENNAKMRRVRKTSFLKLRRLFAGNKGLGRRLTSALSIGYVRMDKKWLLITELHTHIIPILPTCR